jgi:hypothetical protein
VQDSEAVTLWRNTFKLNLSASWKHDVDITVTDIELWKSILAGWKWQDNKGRWHRKAPGIKNLLTEYERKTMEGNNRHGQTPTVPARRSKGLSARRDSELPAMRIQPPSDYFRVD